MKANTIVKKAALAALAFLFWNTTTAQNTVQYKTLSYSSPSNTIIRAVSSTSFVSCQIVNNKSEFMLVDISSPMAPTGASFSFLSNVFVNDFVVINDNVYFCGEYQNPSATSGVIGYFPTSLLTNLSGNVCYYSFLSTEASSFTSIAAFLDPSSQTVKAAVTGYCQTPANLYNNILAVIKFGNNSFEYQYISTQPGPYRQFQDITITDNYFVASGVLENGKGCISVISKNNIGLATYNILVASDCFLSPTRITALDHDRFAFSTAAINGGNVTRVFTCDISSSTVQYQNIQDIVQTAPSSVDEMLYIPNDDELLLLQTTTVGTPSYTAPTIYALNPMGSFYNVNTLSSPLHKYHSLDLLSGSKYIVGGSNSDNAHSFIFRNNQAVPAPQCLISGNEPVIAGSLDYTSQATKLLVSNLYNLSILQPQTLSPVNIYIECDD